VGCAVVSASGSPQKKSPGTLAKVQEAGVLNVGFANEAPYAYTTNKGKLTGEAPALLAAVFKQYGVNKIHGVLTQFNSLIPAINAKRFDVIGAGMYIHPERCAQVAFGNPDFEVKEALVVAKGNPKNIHSYADIKTSGAQLGVVTAGSEVTIAEAAGIPSSQIQLFPDDPSTIAALRGGRVDAVGLSSLAVNQFVKSQSGIEVAKPFVEPRDSNGKPYRGYGAMGF
jgi:polar amino acid transport system substrate-binding protein